MAWNKLNCLVISTALQSLALCCFSGKIQLWWRRMASEWCNRITWFGIWDRPASFACSESSVHHKDTTLLQSKVAFSGDKQELCTFYLQMWWNIIQRKAHYDFFFLQDYLPGWAWNDLHLFPDCKQLVCIVFSSGGHWHVVNASIGIHPHPA